jgi:hypothetical protein
MAMSRLALVLVLLLVGCASVDRAQIADGGTTWVALSKGYVEGNPVLSGLSGPEILAVKLIATQAAKMTPMAFCWPFTFGATATGFGLALWNAGVMLGSGPAALPLVAGLWWWRWDAWRAETTEVCERGLDFSPLEYRHEDGFGNR